MTRVGKSLKDKGHYGRKAVGYTILGLLAPFILLAEGGRWLGDSVFYPLASKLHRWTRPCLYAPRARRPGYQVTDVWSGDPDDVELL